MTYVQIRYTPYLMPLNDVMEAINTSDFTKLKEQLKDTRFFEAYDFEEMKEALIKFIEDSIQK